MASRTCFEVYLSSSTNLFMRNADKWLGIADVGFFRFGSHAASFGREISYLSSTPLLQPKVQRDC